MMAQEAFFQVDVPFE